MNPPITVAILTCSDRCSRGQTSDTTAPPALAALARQALGARIVTQSCVPDDTTTISDTLRQWAHQDPRPDLILTTGGTGLSPRDVTPEATLAVLERRHPALLELARFRCVTQSPRACLSRGEAGTIARTLVVNLPGSQRGAAEMLTALCDILPHAIETLRGAGQHDAEANSTGLTPRVESAKPADSSTDSADSLWPQIATATASRRKLAIATIVRDSGSVPRRSGARMLIFDDGTTHGTIGGGVFELNVIREALAALATGQCVTREYSFNPVGSGPDAFGAVCGGRAEVFLEPVLPADRLLIVGGGHCGRALAHAASLLGWAIVIADDRPEFARRQDFPFPGVEAVVHMDHDFRNLPDPDAQTCVVLVTRGFETDQAALRRVIDSSAAYIGMIGSQKKRREVFAKLQQEGISSDVLSRVHVPVGLDIGAQTPAEIAISILAQIIQVRAQRRIQPPQAPANGPR